MLMTKKPNGLERQRFSSFVLLFDSIMPTPILHSRNIQPTANLDYSQDFGDQLLTIFSPLDGSTDQNLNQSLPTDPLLPGFQVLISSDRP